MELFFVKKKNGKLRLILDTRTVNCLFVDPPKTKLPSAAALTSIESVPGEPLYFAGGDIDNAFYRFEAPAVAREYFTLPPIRARHLGKVRVDGQFLAGDVIVVPRLKVLPMGWSWSLWICQMCLVRAGVLVGQTLYNSIVDKKSTPPLGLHDTVHAKYVDNFLVAGHNPATVDLSANRIT